MVAANMTPRRKGTATDLLAAIAGLAVLAALMAKHRAFFHDDAYITLRYAWNFAATGLPQWNPGEWAEGYTSALHVGLIGGLMRCGMSPVAAAHWVNAAAALALIVFAAKAARSIAPGLDMRAPRAMTIFAVSASPSVAIWVLGGLEAVVAAAFLAGGLAALLADLRQPGGVRLVLAALAFAGAVLTRLDTSVFVAGAGLGLLVAGPGALGSRFAAAALVVGVPAVVAFAQMGVRLQIYGEYFPLTFYAKTDLPAVQRIPSGLAYIARGLIYVPAIGLGAIALAMAVAARRVSGPALLISWAVAPQLIYFVWAGGDHMPAGRMLVPLVAPVALLLLALSTGVSSRPRTILVGASALAALGLGIAQPPMFKDPAAFVGEIVGRHIDETWPGGITVALNTAGSTPFHAREGRIFIDMLGLNDPVIAKREAVPMLAFGQTWPGHSKGDGAYVLSRSPDRIIVGPAEGSDVSEAWFLSGAELAKLPDFHRCYVKVVEEIPYSQELAEQGPKRPNPLIFTYYDRTCQ